jgi:hypothetical protein
MGNKRIASIADICFQGMSIKDWEKLPKNPEDKLKEGQKLATHNLLEAYRKADEKWIPIFKQKLEMTQFPPAERAKLAAGANDIWEDWVKEQKAAGRPGRQVLEFVKAETAKHSR